MRPSPLPFSTKAGTLDSLAGILRSARIVSLVYFSVEEWHQKQDDCLVRIGKALGNGPYIVRSSTRNEDGASASLAGKYLTELNVKSSDLGDSISRVIASYDSSATDEEVLVQPMLSKVLRAGVAFSHDPNTLAPYRTINWSDGPCTSTITGGCDRGRSWQQAAASPHPAPACIGGVVPLLTELLELFGQTPLDCEFAFTREGDGECLWLLQARPLILAKIPEESAQQSARLTWIEEKVRRGMRPHPFLMG